MEIKAAQVKELRDMSGVAMMECKRALVDCEGNIDKALDLLRSNSSLKAEKKASRVAADGSIKIISTESYATIIEINSETDFAAKDAGFIAFTDAVASFISNNKVDDISSFASSEIEEKRLALIQTIGENIQLRRMQTIDFDNSMSVGSYLHSDGKLASLVVINSLDQDLAKDIAMHVAASNPLCKSPEDIDSDVLEREKTIFEVQARESGKEEAIMEKMVEGKIRKFLAEVSLTSQSFIKDPDITVGKLLSEKNADIIGYVRFKVGEGIEVESKSFADEVAEQLK
ncbi:translation elongation factor Ts [Gammaproteobacteria bacterium]|jgi:elongation factor Ts|nr:translation elongation factor Ts [Gammaproteobacteria bacterium]MDB9996801.1 translation elongation factor Ts [Gammaproteobacteria bacterium]|tara:strand:- start:1667 stop:2524 length:858 start_codon:yes stop_codon:yes gene_type:complete